ncbi:hypothetical protein TWF569_006842 [Orbilia oligospora]|nr:hypothetical protein TWF569_006842 [Orbilia oligospora]
MVGKANDKKRLSSLLLVLESSKVIGKVLRGNTGPSGSTSSPRFRAVGPHLLPTEILRLIFELFWDSEPPSADVQSFRQACKLFNQIGLEYIYSDITVSLNDNNPDSGSLKKLIKHRKDIIANISRLHVTGFPPAHRRVGPVALKPAKKYGSESRKASRDNLRTLLELLGPNQLTSFAITGRHIPERLETIPISLLFGKHPHLHYLCIPITLLFKHGINTSEALGSAVVPSFQSLVLTDIQYPRHIADVWALLKNSEDTLKSLAIKSPADSELEKYLSQRSYNRSPPVLPSTTLSLRKIQDLHIEGFSHLGEVLSDCAPNLINMQTLRMLRLERCRYAERFLFSFGAYSTPKLKSLQLFETGSSIGLEGFVLHLGSMELETLVIVLEACDGQFKWQNIKEGVGGSVKRLWIQHGSSYNGPHNVLDMKNHSAPYADTFFPHGWPRLEEVAIDPYYLDGASIVLPETVKVCRIVGQQAQKATMRGRPLDRNVENLVNFRNEEGYKLNVEVSAIGALDKPDTKRIIRHPFFYNTTSELNKNGMPITSRKPASIDQAMKRAPDSHILWYDRLEKPWSDRHGSFWS